MFSTYIPVLVKIVPIVPGLCTDSLFAVLIMQIRLVLNGD